MRKSAKLLLQAQGLAAETPEGSEAMDAKELAALQNRINDLESKLTKLESKESKSFVDMPALDGKINTLRAELDVLYAKKEEVEESRDKKTQKNVAGDGHPWDFFNPNK